MIATTLLLTFLADDAAPARFADPVQLTAGGEMLTDILYPSPTLHDVDGDGRTELLIGDLFGRITVSGRSPDAADTSWAASSALESGGEPLRLNNW